METVSCPGCGEENPSKFRLCGFCGTSLAPPETVSCPSCGEENPGRFRLCGFCGATLGGGPAPGPGAALPAPPPAAAFAPVPDFAPAPAPLPEPGAPAPAPMPASAPPATLPSGEVRKPATFIFVDLKGSTALTERIDQEAMSEIKRTYFTAMAAQVERHGGTVEKYIGDAIMAVFGIPKAREDDALRAVRAAHGMQQELTRLNAEFLPYYGVELANRTGVNTGEVVANTDPSANQQLATGDTVNVAARLEQAAPPNEILIGETTYDLVRTHVEVEPVEPLELKGKAERVPAYRLVTLRDSATVDGRLAHRAPLIGRDGEMDRIRGALRDALVSGGGHLITLVGEAGVGKSRLFEAARDEVSDRARVLAGRCLPYGDGITFWPIVEAVRDAARIAADDTPEVARARIAEILVASPEAGQVQDRLASAIGLSAARYPVAELFWAVRRFLEVLAAERPVVVQFEDIHSAEPTFLDLVEHLVDTLSSSASVLILCAARLPLLDKRPEWGTGERAQRITLTALADADTGALVEALLGGPVVPGLRSRVVEATEGNPLFTEQLVSMLVDKGHIRRTDEGWAPVGDVSMLAVPPTIQALLAARLDDLSREERTTIEPASVIGLVFPQPAVAELVPASLRPGVPQHLAALDRKQLVQREGAGEAEDQAYRFRNLLIRDATYGSLLKRARAQMHERFVTWAERVNRERGREEEFEEILGYHLEQAFRYRTELGPIDADGRSIAERAATKLANAGRRAAARADLPAAVSLLGRAAALLPVSSVTRLEILFDLVEVMVYHGALEEAAAIIAEGARLAAELGDERLIARMAISALELDLVTGTGSAAQQIEQGKALVAVLEGHRDHLALGLAWREILARELTLGRYEAGASSADRLLEHAQLAGDSRLAAQGAQMAAYLMVHGPTPVADGIRLCEEALETVRGNRKAAAVVLAALAQLKAMDGAFDEARDMYQRGRAVLVELEARLDASSTSIEASRVEIRAGDLAAAEEQLRRDDAALASMDERYFRSTVVAILANVLALRGSFDEADSYAALAETLADEDDMESQVSWRAARAKVLAHRGQSEDAVEMAEAAVARSAGGEDIQLRAEALTEHGRVLGMVGRRESAGPPLREALALYESKGDRAGCGLVGRLLSETLSAQGRQPGAG